MHVRIYGLNKGFPGRCRQKNARKRISWSARAASRWILDKLKEDKEQKVLRVQASNETLEGPGSKDLVSGVLPGCPSVTVSREPRFIKNFDSSSNQTGIRKMTSRSEIVVDTSDGIPEVPCFCSVGI